MNVVLIHNVTKTIRVVPEHTDLLFEEGWRMLRHVTESRTNQKHLEDNLEEMLSNRNNNFTKILDI